ncbi:MFS transporter, partial [Amycolatopsis cihanbeyliensis]
MLGRYALPRYLTGATAARTGDEVSGPALLLVGLAATGSVATASGLLAALTISAAIGGPVLGALLDRSRRPGRLLAAALAAYAAGLGVLLAGVGRLPTILTLAVALLAGLLTAAISGGWTAQLPGVVPGDRFARANALDALTFGLAGLAGPALAGLLGSTLG